MALGHGLMDLGGDAERGFWAMGRDRGCHGEAGKSGKACCCCLGPDTFFSFWISVKLVICNIGQHFH